MLLFPSVAATVVFENADYYVDETNSCIEVCVQLSTISATSLDCDIEVDVAITGGLKASKCMSEPHCQAHVVKLG